MSSLIFVTLLLMMLYAALRLKPLAQPARSGYDWQAPHWGRSAQMLRPPVQWRGATYARLLTLLSGNVRVADRLIQHRRADHPARSESWAIEQVIFDLLQDGF
jgi:hypothetical protein